MDADKDLIFQCECNGPHYLKISRHVFQDGELDQWLTMESYGSAPSFWWRIKDCWKLLLYNAHEVQWQELFLTEEKARELAAALLEEADLRQNWQGSVGEESKPEKYTGWKRLTQGWSMSWWLRTKLWWDVSPAIWILFGAGIAWLILR